MEMKKYITLALAALLMMGCSNDDAMDSPAGERLLLSFATSLSDNRPVTRAVDNQIESTDELLCYVRHIVTGETDPVQTKLVTIQNNKPTEALYWDDFSESTEDGAKDLRSGNHGLQSYYGYCNNGGTPTTPLVEATGVLGWTTAADQTAAGTMKENDLLWSKTQDMITYSHAKESRGELAVPYTHAMSKFTIVVVTDDTFGNDDLKNATVTLDGMNKVGTFTAPTADVEPTDTTSVKMFANAVSETDDNKPCRTYEAVAVPKTSLAKDKLLATIGNVSGNDYKVYIDDNILTGWAEGITSDASMSGVNYKLTVTLSKQAITVIATLANWTDVSASGEGDIAFDNDIVNVTVEDEDAAFADGSSFRLYWKNASSTDDYVLATTSTLNGSEWENDPIVYWPNGKDQFFFRALSGDNDKAVKQSDDVLWGTTAKHNNIEAGAAIAPRTGNVPLIFKHSMTKIVFNLTTTTGADMVNLTGATIAISNLYTTGIISIEDGTISVGTTRTENAISGLTDDEPIIVVPQTIGNDAKLTVTLNDGKSTTYSLLLNTCEDADDKAITVWESGKSYTYTITLKKEAIGFRALIKDWDDATGSGHATLDWD